MFEKFIFQLLGIQMGLTNLLKYFGCHHELNLCTTYRPGWERHTIVFSSFKKSLRHMLKKWSSSSLQWTAISNLTQHYYALASAKSRESGSIRYWPKRALFFEKKKKRTDVYCVWFMVTLVHRNIQVAAIPLHCYERGFK